MDDSDSDLSGQNLMDRLDKLVLSLEKSNECKHQYRKLNDCYEQIKQYLPDDLKDKLTNDVDDAMTELFILFENHFYKHGYSDGKKHVGMLNKLLAWLKKVCTK